MELCLVRATKQCGTYIPAQTLPGCAPLCTGMWSAGPHQRHVAPGLPAGHTAHASGGNSATPHAWTLRTQSACPAQHRGASHKCSFYPSQCMLADSYPESGARHTFGLHAASLTDFGPCSPLSLQENHAALPCMPTYYYIMQWALLSPLSLKRGQGALACMPTAVCGRHGCSSHCSLAA